MPSLRPLAGLLLAGLVAVSACETAGTSPPPPGTSPVANSPASSEVTPASTPSPSHLAITSIIAKFDQATFSTLYDVDADNPAGPVSVTWTLDLVLVDPPGAPDPTVPGSKAEVDLACSNNGVGLPNSPLVQRSNQGFESIFTWHHPDPVNSQPPGRYGCDHTKMGPHGHQGLITATANDGVWRCSVSYKGTNSGDSTTPDQPGRGKCTKL